MSIHIRNIANDDLISLAPQLTGLHVQTDFTDHNGRLISGNTEGVKALSEDRIAIKLFRYLNGKQVLDSAAVPAGKDPMGRPWRTSVPGKTANCSPHSKRLRACLLMRR
jgi:hypothetical protein